MVARGVPGGNSSGGKIVPSSKPRRVGVLVKPSRFVSSPGPPRTWSSSSSMRWRSSGLGATAQNEEETAAQSAISTPKSDETSLNVATVTVAGYGGTPDERAIGTCALLGGAWERGLEHHRRPPHNRPPRPGPNRPRNYGWGPQTLIRRDSARGTRAFVAWLVRARWLPYSVGMASRAAIHHHVLKIPASARIPASETYGEVRNSARGTELTGGLLKGWPQGMRLTVRKERPHPGAQERTNVRHQGRQPSRPEGLHTFVATPLVRPTRSRRASDRFRCRRHRGAASSGGWVACIGWPVRK